MPQPRRRARRRQAGTTPGAAGARGAPRSRWRGYHRRNGVSTAPGRVKPCEDRSMSDAPRAWDVFTAGLMDVLRALGSHDVVALSARSAREVTDAFHLTFGTDGVAGEIRAYA